MANTDGGGGQAASGHEARHGQEVPASMQEESHGHTTPAPAKRARRRKSPLRQLRDAEAVVEVKRANAEKYLRRLGDIRDRRFGVGLRDLAEAGDAQAQAVIETILAQHVSQRVSVKRSGTRPGHPDGRSSDRATGRRPMHPIPARTKNESRER